jgi:protein SCO1/2
MQKLINFLPDTNLINENGDSRNLHDLIKGKTIILNMFYSNCKIKCIPLGKLMRRVNLLLNKYILKENIHFISITLDAKNDTVDDIKRFKSRVCSDDCLNWHFYTGNFNDIEILRHKLGMYNPELEIDAIKSNHSGSFMIFNEQTGFIKHTQAFDNSIDIARKIIQVLPKNFYSHSYNLNDVNFDALTYDEIFENIQTMNSVFTVPFLPVHIKNKFDEYAEKQRGFQYNPPIENNSGGSCCCKRNL